MQTMEDSWEIRFDSANDGFHACELDFKFGFDRWGDEFFVFQSKNNDELQRHWTYPSITITCIATGVTDQDVSLFLHRPYLDNYLLELVGNYLVQSWVPVTIEDKKYLTTSDQPFALEKLDHGLCSYRKHHVHYLIPIDDDMSTEQGHLGPPGRVFQNGLPEACYDVRDYTSIEYPLREKAVACGIYTYFALPWSKSSEYKRGRVLEFVFHNENPTALGGYPELIWFGGPEVGIF